MVNTFNISKSNIMIHHNLLHHTEVEPSIAVSANVLVMDGADESISDSCTIDVSPNTMTTSLTKIDSGDGTTWADLSTTGDTGDYSFTLEATSANDTGDTRSMTIRITDDAGEATQVDVTLTQLQDIE